VGVMGLTVRIDCHAEIAARDPHPDPPPFRGSATLMSQCFSRLLATLGVGFSDRFQWSDLPGKGFFGAPLCARRSASDRCWGLN